ncbi:hypothetical protein DBV15_00935 [Temnothorax longispinosus]|uniref:Uncharacterized protein n=1 Tax=Temnothorax longispinosus TaxID=300112 RepID=A0A4S2JBD2_9HYME|nr:hypothetical protein DBV15_00935 [Temnothorax longispinosus]
MRADRGTRAEIEESSCRGERSGHSLGETTSGNYSFLTNRALRPRHRPECISVIVADIVVDRGSIFAKERIIDVFMSRTADAARRTADVLHFRLRFVRYCSTRRRRKR